MEKVPCPSCRTLIVLRHNTYCKRCKKYWTHKQIQESPAYNEELTFDEKQDYALDALVNWCVNTEAHLSVARKLKEDKKDKPCEGFGGRRGRRWCGSTIFLMDHMFKELTKAEPDTVERLGGYRPFIDPGTFLDNIPEAG